MADGIFLSAVYQNNQTKIVIPELILYMESSFCTRKSGVQNDAALNRASCWRVTLSTAVIENCLQFYILGFRYWDGRLHDCTARFGVNKGGEGVTT